MNKNLNLQDVFLNQARKEKIFVTFILTNGFQFKGIIKGFDNYTVILDCDGKQELVWSHGMRHFYAPISGWSKANKTSFSSNTL